MLTKLRFNLTFSKLIGIKGLVQRENRKAYKETSIFSELVLLCLTAVFKLDSINYPFFFSREGTNFVHSVL